MSLGHDNLQKVWTVDLNRFAEDFVRFIAARQQRSPPGVSLVVVPDERWDHLVQVMAPYRVDPENGDTRKGMAYAIREPLKEEEIPDLTKILFPEITDALRTSDLLVVLNRKTIMPVMTPYDFNSLFNLLIILIEKALWLHGYTNLNPLVDSTAFSTSIYFKPARYMRPS